MFLLYLEVQREASRLYPEITSSMGQLTYDFLTSSSSKAFGWHPEELRSIPYRKQQWTFNLIWLKVSVFKKKKKRRKELSIKWWLLNGLCTSSHSFFPFYLSSFKCWETQHIGYKDQILVSKAYIRSPMPHSHKISVLLILYIFSYRHTARCFFSFQSLKIFCDYHSNKS